MRRISLDLDWRFRLEEAGELPFHLTARKNGEAGAYAGRVYRDDYWRHVNLPHDWAIELPFDLESDSRHGHYTINNLTREHRDPQHREAVEPRTGIGWYRKHFMAPAEWAGKRVSVEFDGIYRDAIIYFNGQPLERHMSGYTPVALDVSDNLIPGEENVIAVRVDASQFEGWWYEGAGIYRHARLIVSEKVHVEHESLYIASKLDGSIAVKATVMNEGECDVSARARLTIADPDGKIVWTAEADVAAAAFGKADVNFAGRLDAVRPWSIEMPERYLAKLEIVADGQVIDGEETYFGIREALFDSEKGFFLNGEHVKLKGVCMHQDFAGLGVALPDAVQEFKIMRLKEMGVNAYRTSHHAPTPELLDACDRLGMLIMDETRAFGSDPEALRQLTALVKRDRNHPCVILWSIGNEEHTVQNNEVGARMARTMMRVVRSLDDTRLITYGGNNGAPYEGINGVVDVRGVNYVHIQKEDFVNQYHADHPHQPIIGSEEASSVYARGEYVNDGLRGIVSAYDENTMPWGSTAEGWWKFYMARPWLAGGFLWTGFDYGGEPAPYYTNTSSSFGVIDWCGFPKDVFYYYQAWWTKREVLHLMPHWNWEAGQEIRVIAYANCDEVELLLNGESLGKKSVPALGHLEWRVAFVPGVLKAIGYRNGEKVSLCEKHTAGQPARIQLHEEFQKDGVSLVRAQVVDAQGHIVPDASNLIHFEAVGGRLMGVGNGDPTSVEKQTFLPQEILLPITGWQQEIAGEWVAADVFAPSTDARYTCEVKLPPEGRKGMYTPNIFPFEDEHRLVFEGEQIESRTAKYRVRFRAEGEKTTLYFPRVEGRYEIHLNGELLAKGNAQGYEMGFDVILSAGENLIEVSASDKGMPGGVFDGVFLKKHTEPDWTRSAFHGLCLVIAENAQAITARAEGLEPDSIACCRMR